MAPPDTNTERIVAKTINWLPVKEIATLPATRRSVLRREIDTLYGRAFPRISLPERDIFVADFFDPPDVSDRFAHFIRDEDKRLTAAIVFDRTTRSIRNALLSAIYIISRAVDPGHQAKGTGKMLASQVLADFLPHFLFAACGQSSALHSWLRLVQRSQTDYEAFPHLRRQADRFAAVRLRADDLQTAGVLLAELCRGILPDNPQARQRTLKALNHGMVIKKLFKRRYDFDPWAKGGRIDHLAQALGVVPGDGVIVTVVKKREKFPGKD